MKLLLQLIFVGLYLLVVAPAAIAMWLLMVLAGAGPVKS